MLTNQDVQQIEAHGGTLKETVKQLETFVKGTPFVTIVTSASVGNGIVEISPSDQQKLISLFDAQKEALDMVKFVPASGAATRMFKMLHSFLDRYNFEEQTLREYIKEGGHKDLDLFFSNIKEFAFINLVRKKIRQLYPDYKHYNKGKRCYYLVKTLLGEEGLNYSNFPKGLIPFHKYNKYTTTAFEEQLYEAAFYASAKEEAYLHFTFSEDHVPFFKEKFEAIQARVSKKTKTRFNISYSFQKKETDTIAVTKDNKPFRDEEGKLVFRPSGHGALLDNLNEVDADLVFIKNIDNVVTEAYVEPIAHYKKVLAGKLLWLQKKINHFLELLEKDEVSEEVVKEIKTFLFSHLNVKNIPNEKNQLAFLLIKPLRVCGVVKNTGAPGGGPYWVKNENGNVSLQIVEMAQINTADARQNAIVQEATHFNPVDIVCGVRDCYGKKFDLLKYRDPNTGFISEKSKDGKVLKALELPGLWNGGMAKWNTVFVEVPSSTFHPVKTVNDLLAKEHRPDA